MAARFTPGPASPAAPSVIAGRAAAPGPVVEQALHRAAAHVGDHSAAVSASAMLVGGTSPASPGCRTTITNRTGPSPAHS
jgi:hypothetical protein